jgi:hypothetical protein
LHRTLKPESTNFQIPNNKQMPMTKIPNSNHLSPGWNSPQVRLGHWILEFVAFALRTAGAWDLGFFQFHEYICFEFN